MREKTKNVIFVGVTRAQTNGATRMLIFERVFSPNIALWGKQAATVSSWIAFKAQFGNEFEKLKFRRKFSSQILAGTIEINSWMELKLQSNWIVFVKWINIGEKKVVEIYDFWISMNKICWMRLWIQWDANAMLIFRLHFILNNS